MTARNLNRNSDVLIRSIMENGAESKPNTNGRNSHSNSTTKQTKAGRHASSSSRLSIQALSEFGDGEDEAVVTNLNAYANANVNNANNASNAKRNKPRTPWPSAVVAAVKRQSYFELFPGLGLNIGNHSSTASRHNITTANVNATSNVNSKNADIASDKNTNTSINSMPVDSSRSDPDPDLQVAVLANQFPRAVNNKHPQAKYNYYRDINSQLVHHQQLQQQQVYQSPLFQPHRYQATPTRANTFLPQMDMQTPRQQTPSIPQLQQMGRDDDDDAMIDDLYDHVRYTFGRLHTSTSISVKFPPELHQQHQEQQLYQQPQTRLLRRQQQDYQQQTQNQNLHQHYQYQNYAETEQPSQISWVSGNQTSETAMYSQNKVGDNEDEDKSPKRLSTRRIMSLFRAAEAIACDTEPEENSRTKIVMQINANQEEIQNWQPQQSYYQQQEQAYQQQQYELQVSVSTTVFDSDDEFGGRFGSMSGIQHEGSVANTPPLHMLPFVCDICARAVECVLFLYFSLTVYNIV
ncbi:hypothetical protein HK100_005204 [Physocladia obscura]|uniref:Uncharacterized protein n=1 Tax=Physocladia obscura TaxID=109957 RepID=A0AAD5SRZ1_9FUNG|nr:hypothetical protein HK100_005204 [Physocladia obscura]